MSNPDEQRPDGTAQPDGTVTESPDDELRRRYREALERKHGDGPRGAGGHPGSKGPAPASNDKRQRTFRRKSG